MIKVADPVRDAMADALAGWQYIRTHHGDLYGVGWDRVEQKLTAALALTPQEGGAEKSAREMLTEVENVMRYFSDALRKIADYSPASIIQPVAIAREALNKIGEPWKDGGHSPPYPQLTTGVFATPPAPADRRAVIEECARAADIIAAQYARKVTERFMKEGEGRAIAARDAADEIVEAIRALYLAPTSAEREGSK